LRYCQRRAGCKRGDTYDQYDASLRYRHFFSHGHLGSVKLRVLSDINGID